MEEIQNDTDLIKTEDDSVDKTSKLKNWDISLVIAISAVFISLISAFIGFRESNILSKQHEILTSQQEASVWPFLENRAINTYAGDSAVTFKYVITNKGVGPAIIDDVTYKYDGKEFEQHLFYKVLEERYSDKVEVKQIQNSSLNKVVLAPGDVHVVITQKLKRKSDAINIGDVVDELNDMYRLEYCYCSVYGKCWFVSAWNKIAQSDNCKFREDIR